MQLQTELVSTAGNSALALDVNHLVIAGWAGRDVEAMEHHIQELEALGIKRPDQTPTYYRVAANRLTQAPVIECNGPDSSGEAETIVFAQGGKLYVGLSSDHTDRKVEAYGITVSKQMCDKPVGPQVWPFDEVAGHWDQLILRSWLTENGTRVLYQEGAVAGLRDPRELIALYTGGGSLPDGAAILGGTMPAIGGVRAGERFECELVDPVLSRKLVLRYDVEVLPIAG